MTLRVGIICPYSLSVPGGVQMQVLGLARELRSRGIEARVLGPCDGPPPESFVTPLGSSLPTSANGSIAPLAPDPPAMFRTLQALTSERFDVVHLHEPMVPGPALTATVTHRYPTVGTFHAAGRSTSYRLIKPWLQGWIKRIDHKVVVSKDALELVQSHLGGEYEVLFNGVEVGQIRETEPIPRAPGTPPAIFFCGRHEQRKGLDVLIEAFTNLGVDAELWIASTGPDTARLTARTAGDPRVRWLGRITDDEKFARLRSAEVFCAPSLGGESFGVVLLEAMAAGTTVVASGLDGYRNVVTDDVDALLCAPGDAAALGAVLERALTDATMTARLRAAGSERAEQFGMAALADRYVEIYHDLARSRSRTLRP
ncbi:glycosyltransferase family 4 protein [Ilumatobacter nonamiensis]|uniref:glycosyltransferase family 4 protein n=1 Tax=Ilumatobacter nonamiensis TaxID=467093 RepID=UPI00034BF047|nr:glycosyltransferase family 4 protein [Ilumatobacter nonamiensis]